MIYTPCDKPTVTFETLGELIIVEHRLTDKYNPNSMFMIRLGGVIIALSNPEAAKAKGIIRADGSIEPGFKLPVTFSGREAFDGMSVLLTEACRLGIIPAIDTATGALMLELADACIEPVELVGAGITRSGDNSDWSEYPVTGSSAQPLVFAMAESP